MLKYRHTIIKFIIYRYNFVTFVLQNRYMARKTKKICLVCGNDFNGTAAAQTCSGACRIALSRIKHSKKRPEYILIAKGKGQKIPNLNAPKGLRFKKGEKKKKPDLEILESKIEYKTPTPESYDAEKMDIIKHDELGQWQEVEVRPLTEIEKLTKIGELERSLNAVDRETMPVGMMPKMFGLIKADKKKEIQEQINKLNQ